MRSMYVTIAVEKREDIKPLGVDIDKLIEDRGLVKNLVTVAQGLGQDSTKDSNKLNEWCLILVFDLPADTNDSILFVHRDLPKLLSKYNQRECVVTTGTPKFIERGMTCR